MQINAFVPPTVRKESSNIVMPKYAPCHYETLSTPLADNFHGDEEADDVFDSFK